ncbi:hypothetical protein CB0940_01844 [Cercospora beticola]|uniref:Uncharacterized protein n=1 Tax=Cercospora beticola TaxID=122368 RepID=A0A2G5I9G2_CERBT|nr:hypothetical protein CB0940_01844 [Cercospora beticola]PIB01352.1 hypothetical protein CB0940_01844 [Cercospora beticola]WPA97298.1 hypothetical protein RHO25_001907 [Cercospora beticola]CAK1354286.1 unnamed protein product [Cercospora beticola]
MNQKRLDHIFDQVQAMHDELRKRLDDFDQQALDRAGPLAQAISDEVVNRRLKGMFVSFKKDIDARVQSHESANEKQQREFEATLNARIDNINARIDNTTKTQCEKALQPHLKELDEAKATVASFRKQLGQHVTDANTTLGHLKQQQTSNASEMETLRKDHSNFVLSNSSDFQTLRTTVEKREKTIKSQDEAIEKINNDIVRIKKNGLDVLSAVKIVGQRSRSNREVLRKTLRHVIEVEHVALKVEEALLEMDILDDQGFLKPNEKRPKDSRLDKSAYELGHKDNNPLEADPSCITLLQEDQAPAQAAGEQPPPPAS